MRNFSVRNPLLLRGAIALLGMGTARLLVALGAIPAEWDLDEARVEQVIDGFIVAWAWFSARAKVTPVADPRGGDGVALVRAEIRRL